MVDLENTHYNRTYMRRVRNIVRRVPLSFVLSPTLIFAGMLYGALGTPSTASDDALRLFLSALAGAQASLIAIVFAVTILAIQLTANRYTMRIAPVFYRHPVFRITLFAFLLSIGVDLGLLFFQQYATSSHYQAILYGSIGLALGNAWLFVLYIRTSITLNTPEGIISAVGEEITPAKFFEQLQQSDSTVGRSHPLLPIYSIARSAIDDGEPETAQVAIQHYGKLASDILTEAIENKVFPNLSKEIQRKAVEEIFELQLPNIAMRAESIEESTLVNEVIELQGDLGVIGLGPEYHLITTSAFGGLVDLSRIDAPVNKVHYRIHSGVWRELGNLLISAAEHPAPMAVDHLIISMRSIINQQLSFDFSFDIHPRIVMNYLTDLQEVQSLIIEEYNEDLAKSEFDWFEGYDQADENDGLIALLRCRDQIFEISGRILQLLDEEEPYPVTEGTFRRFWRELAVEAINSGLPEYGQTMCEAMIELAYIEPLRSDRNHDFWITPLARVMAESDPAVVQAAFDRILQFEKLEQDQRDGDITIWGIDDRDERYYNHLDARFPELNAHTQFPERVLEIREQVQVRYEEITD